MSCSLICASTALGWVRVVRMVSESLGIRARRGAAIGEVSRRVVSMVTVLERCGLLMGRPTFSLVMDACRYGLDRLDEITGLASETGSSSDSARSMYARAVFDRDR